MFKVFGSDGYSDKYELGPVPNSSSACGEENMFKHSQNNHHRFSAAQKSQMRIHFKYVIDLCTFIQVDFALRQIDRNYETSYNFYKGIHYNRY